MARGHEQVAARRRPETTKRHTKDESKAHKASEHTEVGNKVVLSFIGRQGHFDSKLDHQHIQAWTTSESIRASFATKFYSRFRRSFLRSKKPQRSRDSQVTPQNPVVALRKGWAFSGGHLSSLLRSATRSKIGGGRRWKAMMAGNSRSESGA